MKINTLQNIKTFIGKFKKTILQDIINPNKNFQFGFFPLQWHTPFEIAIEELEKDKIIQNFGNSSEATKKYMNPSYLYTLIHKNKR